MTINELVEAIADERPLTAPETPELTARLNHPDALRVHAIYYASIGWPVFPLVAGGKIPVTPNGFKDATTDAATVADWWRTMPHANIGIPTGRLFDVIDIDAPDGYDSYASFAVALLAAEQTHPDVLAVAYTGSGGSHVFIPPVDGARNGAGLGGKAGLDYRANGGYIVAPPSRLTGGTRYRWALPPDTRLLGDQ